MTLQTPAIDSPEIPLTVTILIPFREWTVEVEQAVTSCLEQSHPAHEIILLPDYALLHKVAHCLEIATGPVFPGQKRNRGVQAATGSLIACLDADAVADQDWISNALPLFADQSVAVVGGPNLPPLFATEGELASWEIMSSPVLTGPLASRYRQVPAHDRLELQSSNMFIRTDSFKAVGGFREDLLTAEDTDLCFRLAGQGKRILYHPGVIVQHRPRPLFCAFMKQMFRYARDQVLVLHHLPFRSSLLWFGPALFVLFIVVALGLLRYGHPSLLLLGLISYLSWTMGGALWSGSRSRFFLRWLGVLSMHLSYSSGFWFGLWIHSDRFFKNR